MENYNFININPNDIFRVYRSDDYKQIEIVTVSRDRIFINLSSKEECYDYINELRKYCMKKRIGVTVRGYNDKE